MISGLRLKPHDEEVYPSDEILLPDFDLETVHRSVETASKNSWL